MRLIERAKHAPKRIAATPKAANARASKGQVIAISLIHFVYHFERNEL